MAHEHPIKGDQSHERATYNQGYGVRSAVVQRPFDAEQDDHRPKQRPNHPQPEKYAHCPSLPYDDTSVNGSINPEFQDEEGEPWDCDNGFPEETEDDEEEADEG